MKKIVYSLLLLCSVLFIGSTSIVADEIKMATDFTLPGLDGKMVSLSDYRGQWVVVNFWATWCAPCRKEIPDLSQLHTQRDDVTVLGLDYEDIERSKLDEFLTDIKVAYPVLLLDVYAMPTGLEVPRALPTTFVVNPKGEQVRTFYGPITREEIERVMD